MNRKDLILLDACVLVSFPFADTALRCAEDPKFYHPLWSNRILGEVRAALTGKLNLPSDKADRRISAMEQAFPEVMVDGYQPLEPWLETINPNDRHVLAAAIRGGAGRILTQNTRHFPNEAVAPFQIEVVSPADMIQEWFGQDMDLFMEKIQQQAAAINETFDYIFLNFSRYGIDRAQLDAMLVTWEIRRKSPLF